MNTNDEELTDSDILKYASIGLSAFTVFIFTVFYCILSRSITPLFYLIIFTLFISQSLKPEISCEYCELQVSSKKELNTHLLSCKQKQILSLKEDIKSIRHKKDKKYKQLNDKVKQFETELLEIKSKLNIKSTIAENLEYNEDVIKTEDLEKLKDITISDSDAYEDDVIEDDYSKV